MTFNVRLQPAVFTLIVAFVLIALTGCERADRAFLGPRRCAIEGLDVSRHQGTIDWAKVAASRARFVWIKATEGGDYLDPAFRRNWLLARASGVRRGAYHFVYWCRPAQDQAAWFIANVPAAADALPPVLDVEWNPASKTCARKLDRATALPMMKTILAAMEKAYGRKPLIYAPLDFYEDVMAGSLEDYPLWVRNIDDEPAEGYEGRRWTIWQHREDGRVDGIDAAVDVDCFNGDAAAWRKWTASHSN